MDAGDTCGGAVCAPGEQCLADACYGNVCDGTICPPGQVCAMGVCVEAVCIGISCPAGTRCAGGVCVSDSCGGAQCPMGEVCVAGACVEGACAFVTCTNGGVCVGGVCRFPGCGSAQCSTGYVCTASSSCRSTACAGVACPVGQLCNAGACFPTSCGATPCGPGEVCDDGACVPLDCAGIDCPMGEACAAGGRCLPRACAGVPCPGVWVCDMGTCVDPRCPGGDVCSGGTCWPLGPPGEPPCGAGRAFIRGACRELMCEGVNCPTGQSCQGGACYPGVGVFPAGYTRASGSGTAEGVVATREQGSWKKLNHTPLPPIIQLALSPDGQTLYAVGNDGSFHYSTDGVVWNQRWTGTPTVSGAFVSVEVDKKDGTLYGALQGEALGTGAGLGRVIISRDRGDTWSPFITPPAGGFGARTSVLNVSAAPAPDRLFYATHDSYLYARREVVLWQGGLATPLYSYGNGEPAATVRAHPVNPNWAFVYNNSVSLLDVGGDTGVTRVEKAAFNSCPNCTQWKTGDPAVVLASSGQQVFKSTNGGDSWGARTVGIPGGAALRHLAQDRGGAFYVGNEAAGQATLLGTVDDGETWQTLNRDMNVVPGLFDPYPTWTPDASYASNALVMPTVPNGTYYRATTAGVSGGSEPAWPTDAGATVNDGTARWVVQGQPSLMRVTTVAARTCPLGEVLCGVTCVPVFDNPQHCGGCGRAWAATSACAWARWPATAASTVARPFQTRGCWPGPRRAAPTARARASPTCCATLTSRPARASGRAT